MIYHRASVYRHKNVANSGVEQNVHFVSFQLQKLTNKIIISISVKIKCFLPMEEDKERIKGCFNKFDQ